MSGRFFLEVEVGDPEGHDTEWVHSAVTDDGIFPLIAAVEADQVEVSRFFCGNRIVDSTTGEVVARQKAKTMYVNDGHEWDIELPEEVA